MTQPSPPSWDERFSASGYLFGTEPNAFLAGCGAWLPSGGQVLSVADGEGRNSVWLAQQGLRVTAVESSPVAVAKARALAQERGVAVDFQVADVFDWPWPVAAFDVVAAIFIQFVGPQPREVLFQRMTDALKPGGVLLLQGYTPRQLEYRTGGPPFVENLYTADLLRRAFAALDVLHLREHDAEIHEGRGHAGMSALIDLVARKPG